MGGDLSCSTALCPASSLDPGQIGRELVPDVSLEGYWQTRVGGAKGQRERFKN